METRKRKAAPQNIIDPKRPCLARFLDNSHIVYLIVSHMLPYLSIWAVKRLSIVSKTFREAISYLHQDVVYWCSPLSSRISYSSNAIDKPAVPFHHLRIFYFVKAGQYAAVLKTYNGCIRPLVFIRPILSILISDTAPVTQPFIDFFESIKQEYGVDVSGKDELKFEIIHAIASVDVSCTTFTPKFTHIISHYITTSDLYGFHSKYVCIFNYLLDQPDAWDFLLFDMPKQAHHLKAMLARRSIDIQPSHHNIDHVWLYQCLKNGDIQPIDDIFSLLHPDQFKAFIELLYSVDHKAFFLNRPATLAIFTKYLTLDTLNHIFPVVSPLLPPTSKCEPIAIALDDMDYISRLYEIHVPNSPGTYFAFPFQAISTITMFIHIWGHYFLPSDLNRFLEIINSMIQPQLIPQVLDFFGTPPLTPFYIKNYLCNVDFRNALLLYEINKETPLSDEAIKYYSRNSSMKESLLRTNPRLALFKYHLMLGNFKEALKVYIPGMRYTFSCSATYPLDDSAITIISNSERITKESMNDIIYRLIEKPRHWKHSATTLIDNNAPGFFAFLQSQPYILPGLRSLIMEKFTLYDKRQRYFERCQQHPIKTHDEAIELYRLSIQYKLLLTHSCRKYFY